MIITPELLKDFSVKSAIVGSDFPYGSPNKAVLSYFRDKIKACSSCPSAVDRPCGPFVPEGNPDSPFILVLRNPSSLDTHSSGFMRYDTNYGKTFELYLRLLGLQRSELYITCTSFCPVPNQRYFTSIERTTCCDLFKDEEFGGLYPRLVLLMGQDALNQFIGEEFSMSGHWNNIFFVRNTFIVPIFHVGYFLDHPEEQSGIIKHLSIIKKRLVLNIQRGLL